MNFRFIAKCAGREKKEMVTNGIESLVVVGDKGKGWARCVLGENFRVFLFSPPLSPPSFFDIILECHLYRNLSRYRERVAGKD